MSPGVPRQSRSPFSILNSPHRLAVALSSTRLVGAAGTLATCDIDRVPGPARTAAGRAAVDPDGIGAAIDVSRNAIQLKVSDRDARRSRAAVVGLRDVDAVLGDPRESDVLVIDALDGTRVARDGLLECRGNRVSSRNTKTCHHMGSMGIFPHLDSNSILRVGDC